jgi:hypothetical protein
MVSIIYTSNPLYNYLSLYVNANKRLFSLISGEPDLAETIFAKMQNSFFVEKVEGRGAWA